MSHLDLPLARLPGELLLSQNWAVKSCLHLSSVRAVTHPRRQEGWLPMPAPKWTHDRGTRAIYQVFSSKSEFYVV